MNKVNEITICRDKFRNQNEFENAIKNAVLCLLENDYVMTIDWSERVMGHVWIKFNYNEQEYGCDYPYWLSPDEADSVITDEEREEQKKELECPNEY